MTLLQAIKAARRITIFNGGMALDITKKQAGKLRAQAIWIPSEEWDGGECHWELEGGYLRMYWPQ